MFTMLLPELRPYLEHLLNDALAQADMTIRQQATREHVLCLLQKELVRFIFTQLMAALPQHARCQFTSLLEQGASLETLQAFTMRYISNIPAFVVQVFQEFRARFIPSEQKAVC